MKRTSFFLAVLALSQLFVFCGAKQTLVEITTDYGVMEVRLYDETPLHRDNFIKLVEEGFFDDLLFHRVIPEFMIQGGDPDSRGADSAAMLGAGGPDYQLDAEILYPQFFHKKGVLSAARQGDQVNPEKKSSGSQFYIVQGKVFEEGELTQLEQMHTERKKQQIFMKYAEPHRATLMGFQQAGDRAGWEALMAEIQEEAAPELEAMTPFVLPEEHKAVYTTLGGAPHLDGEYTVFGEVVKGLEVIDSIASVATNRMDRPVEDVKMQMRLIKR
ncbi:peptidylprolyl isomerase [Geofilum rhodophaeum]|uniref:peptidylprolyl isomerase n=1 Tax=Geofilum rhodophaeum TaxID=1965019 RepID=UPI000B52403A|nr:peptidylprolyl isomerase [Geofilum rhodophaeum]